MPNIQYGNRMPHRQYVNGTIQDKIYKKSILHIDAWMYQLKDDNLYLVLETRKAGVELTEALLFRLHPGEIVPVAWSGDIHATGLTRHCDSPWARKHAPWLRALHDDRIRAEMRMPREGYASLSVKLHYVYTDRTLDDPLAGISNAYATTGRAIRDAALHTPLAALMNASIRPPVRANSAWTAKERSILRTLDKLLK